MRLPTEVVSQVAQLLSRGDLASCSLVCQSWRTAMILALYYSVILSENSHVEQFASTLEASTIPVASLIKKLRIELEDDDIDEDVLVLIEPHVSKFSSLLELSWNLLYVPENLKLITLFQTQCPNLSSVDLLVPRGFDFESTPGQSQYSTLLGFKGLVEFQLEITEIPVEIERNHTSPLKTLLLNSPQLQSLTLYLETEDDQAYYSPDRLAAAFGSTLELPNLRTLKISGSVELDESTILSPPEQGSHHFRDFLSRHPKIEDLELRCSYLVSDHQEINPTYFSPAIPSLKYFEGPDHLCDQLIRSTVAPQLETLTIRHSTFEHGLNFVLDENFPVKPLTNLRKLEIGTDELSDAFEMMRLILPATENLVKLHIGYVPNHYHLVLLSLLTHTPNLQMIFMRASPFSMNRAMSFAMGIRHLPFPGEEEEILHDESLKQKLKIVCPKLKIINGKLVGRT